MPFNSITFAGFFLCVLAFHSLPLSATVRKLNLLIASYIFYSAWDVRFPLLLLFATFTNYFSSHFIEKWNRFSKRRRVVLWLNVAINIGLLCAFKYGNDLIAAWLWLVSVTEVPGGLEFTPSIILPIGLSFFTFQALSYTIDVYRRTITPVWSVMDFALFVSFFPVLLAGPLLRAGPFLVQAVQPRRATGAELGSGAAFITLGLFMKVALADYLLAPIVRQVFDPMVSPGTLAAWIGTLSFAAQDYCDFAGYSTCAVGIGRCLGLTLPNNFRAPLSSVGFRDLWQRWHITLVAWMRDYVFNTLGGVFKGYRRAAINVLIVFFLIGLWHGAKWTYLIFGLLHGCYLIGEVILQRSAIRRMRLWNNPIGTCLMWLATMFLCMIAFVFYRAPQLEQSWGMLTAMFGARRASAAYELTEFEVVVAILVVESLVTAHWLCRNMPLDELLVRAPWWAVAICLAIMLLAITLCSGESESYLYFHY